jgi:hypothetical protein
MSVDLAEYRSLVRDLGTWADAFDVRSDARPQITLRGAMESSTFTTGDTSVYRFGNSIVVQRRLPGAGGDAYFVLRPDTDGPRLVRKGVIGAQVPPSIMDALTDSLVQAAQRTRDAAA